MKTETKLSLKTVVIGAGAAGNKAVAALVQNNTIRLDEAILVNSTNRDLPNDIDKEGIFINITNSSDDGGSAKEPKIAEALTIEAIKSGKLNLDELIPLETDLVIFIGALEGGTGNGSIPIMAKYVRDKLGFKTHIIAIKGFGSDARGLDNTISFFKKMQSNYAISCIDNSKFLNENRNNFKKAEEMANNEIVSRVATLRGFNILPSDQNIDEKELRKIATREGFCNIEYYEVPDHVKIKNIENFNDIIKEIIDNTKGIDILKPSQKCMGIIINLPESEQQYIDFKFPLIKEVYGNPFEIYPHIQNVNQMPRFISFICTGMKMPIDELKAIQENFKKEFMAVDTDTDNFFDEVRGFNSVPSSSLFDLDEAKPATKNIDKNDFLDDILSSFESNDNKDDNINNF